MAATVVAWSAGSVKPMPSASSSTQKSGMRLVWWMSWSSVTSSAHFGRPSTCSPTGSFSGEQPVALQHQDRGRRELLGHRRDVEARGGGQRRADLEVGEARGARPDDRRPCAATAAEHPGCVAGTSPRAAARSSVVCSATRSAVRSSVATSGVSCDARGAAHPPSATSTDDEAHGHQRPSRPPRRCHGSNAIRCTRDVTGARNPLSRTSGSALAGHMSDDKHDQQSDAEIVEQEQARTEALEYGQDHVVGRRADEGRRGRSSSRAHALAGRR